METRTSFAGNTGRVFQHLKDNEGITSKEAFELYGATRLSAIIFNLRKAGYKINSVKKQKTVRMNPMQVTMHADLTELFRIVLGGVPLKI